MNAVSVLCVTGQGVLEPTAEMNDWTIVPGVDEGAGGKAAVFSLVEQRGLTDAVITAVIAADATLTPVFRRV